MRNNRPQTLIIRQAYLADLIPIKRLADNNRESLGFIRYPSLYTGIEKQWLLVACTDDQIAGFAHYRLRRDLQITLSALCVDVDHRRAGIGSALVSCLLREAERYGKTHIILKCPVDLPANNFYQQRGFIHIRQEMGKKRMLNTWRYDVRSDLLRRE